MALWVLVSLLIAERGERGCSVSSLSKYAVNSEKPPRSSLSVYASLIMLQRAKSGIGPKLTLYDCVVAFATAQRRSLFRPYRNSCCDGGCGSLNKPFIFAAWSDGEAIRPGVLPTSAEAFCIEFPNTDVCFTGLCESLTRHFAVRCKGHLKFGAGRRSSGKWLTVEKRRLDIARGHRLCCVGWICSKDNYCNK